MAICNFGSLNIDHVYAVDTFVRPGETITSNSYRRFAGGKGLNQSLACARAGALVYHAGAIGAEGVFLKEILSQSGVDTRFVQLVNEPSGHAIIQVDTKGANCIILHPGANRTIDESFVELVLGNFLEGDFLVLQNEISSLPYIIERAYDIGMRIMLNPSPITAELQTLKLDKVAYLVLNEIEGASFAGRSTPREILDELCNRYSKMGIVLTLGADGVMYGKGTYRDSVPALKVDAVDTTAAGDTFTGYFYASIADGIELRSALMRASKAAAVCVTRHGASESIPYKKEID